MFKKVCFVIKYLDELTNCHMIDQRTVKTKRIQIKTKETNILLKQALNLLRNVFETKPLIVFFLI